MLGPVIRRARVFGVEVGSWVGEGAFESEVLFGMYVDGRSCSTMGWRPPSMLICVCEDEKNDGFVYPGKFATVAKERRQSNVAREEMASRNGP